MRVEDAMMVRAGVTDKVMNHASVRGHIGTRLKNVVGKKDENERAKAPYEYSSQF